MRKNRRFPFFCQGRMVGATVLLVWQFVGLGVTQVIETKELPLETQIVLSTDTLVQGEILEFEVTVVVTNDSSCTVETFDDLAITWPDRILSYRVLDQKGKVMLPSDCEPSVGGPRVPPTSTSVTIRPEQPLTATFEIPSRRPKHACWPADDTEIPPGKYEVQAGPVILVYRVGSDAQAEFRERYFGPANYAWGSAVFYVVEREN